VENLLLSTEGYIRLCDFGSATTTSYYPDHTWSALQRSTVEDEARFCLLNILLFTVHLHMFKIEKEKMKIKIPASYVVEYYRITKPMQHYCAT